MPGLDLLIGPVCAGLVALCVWMMKRTNSRLDKFDERLRTAVTESEVRTIIDDKINPIKDELTRLDKKLDLLIQIAVRQLPKINE